MHIWSELSLNAGAWTVVPRAERPQLPSAARMLGKERAEAPQTPRVPSPSSSPPSPPSSRRQTSATLSGKAAAGFLLKRHQSAFFMQPKWAT